MTTIKPGQSMDPAFTSGWGAADHHAHDPREHAHGHRPDVGPVIAEARAGGASEPFSELTARARGEKPKRYVKWFTFPVKFHKEMMEAGLPKEHLRFAVCAMTTIEEERVYDLFDGSAQQKVGAAMVRTSVYAIGHEHANDDMRAVWWEKIGPIGRSLALRCYQELNFADEAAGEAILGTAEPGWI